MKTFSENPFILKSPISKLYFIKHDQESLLKWIQPLTTVLDLCLRTRMWTILRMGYWDKGRICWFCSHHRKIHSCIESTSDSIVRPHTRSKLRLLFLFFQTSCKIIFHLTIFLSFFFMKIPIRWSYTNRKENSVALDLLCRNVLLKKTKYYANHYHLRSFDLKQDMQILIDRRRPSGTPLPTRPALSALHSRNDLVLLPHG